MEKFLILLLLVFSFSNLFFIFYAIFLIILYPLYKQHLTFKAYMKYVIKQLKETF